MDTCVSKRQSWNDSGDRRALYAYSTRRPSLRRSISRLQHSEGPRSYCLTGRDGHMVLRAPATKTLVHWAFVPSVGGERRIPRPAGSSLHRSRGCPHGSADGLWDRNPANRHRYPIGACAIAGRCARPGRLVRREPKVSIVKAHEWSGDSATSLDPPDPGPRAQFARLFRDPRAAKSATEDQPLPDLYAKRNSVRNH